MPSAAGLPNNLGGKGFYWGGPGTGSKGGASRTRLQPINRGGQRGANGRGLIYLDMHDVINKIGRIRFGSGKAINASGFATAANRRAAIHLQELMVEERNKTVRRPKVSTGRLDQAILAEQNRFVSSSQIGVGIPGFLTQKAPYWRAIEEGTSYFVGRTIYGVFGESLSGETASGGAYGPYPLAGGRYTPFGANRAGRLIPPGGMRQAGLTGKGAAQRLGFTRGAKRGVIKRPIQRQAYMRNAWRKFDARKVGLAMAREQIALIKGSGFTQTSIPNRD